MKEKSRPLNWWGAGVLLAVLNVLIINVYVANRPIGASGAYPDLAGWLSGLSEAAYIKSLGTSHWELYFLLGALLGGFGAAVVSGDFQVKLIPDLWRRLKGEAPGKRILWALVGGFYLIFGARLAGGCTSGHILSGGMQLALSSLLFAGVAIAAFLTMGYFFYRK
jgi:uncharacterized membrane protein YedE/YeeE